MNKFLKTILLFVAVFTLYSCDNTRAENGCTAKDDSIVCYKHTIDSLYNTVIYGQKVEIAELKERHAIDSTNYENALEEIERLNDIIKSMKSKKYTTPKKTPPVPKPQRVVEAPWAGHHL